MKKRYIILLFVMAFALSGCNCSRGTVQDTLAGAGTETQGTNDNVDEYEDEGIENSETAGESNSKQDESASESNPDEKEEQQGQGGKTSTSTEQRQGTQTSEQMSEQALGQTSETVSESQTQVGYNPNTVVSLAIAKCQAGGMITTQDNLANALAEGRITQEEYNEYYPYDGLDSSYYSVFVETDLNQASTVSGQPLRSEDAIATYIADMLLLEQSRVFNVVYAGVYSKNGTDFYEFRCLR